VHSFPVAGSKYKVSLRSISLSDDIQPRTVLLIFTTNFFLEKVSLKRSADI